MLGLIEIAAVIGISTLKIISTALKIDSCSSYVSRNYSSDPYEYYHPRHHMQPNYSQPAIVEQPVQQPMPQRSRRWDSQFGYYYPNRLPQQNYSQPYPVNNTGYAPMGTMNQVTSYNYNQNMNNNMMNQNMMNNCPDMTSRRYMNQQPTMQNNYFNRFQQQPMMQNNYFNGFQQQPPGQRYNIQPPPSQQQGMYNQPTQCVDWRMFDHQRQMQNNQCVGSTSKPWDQRQPIFNWDYIRKYGWGEPEVQKNSDDVVAMFYDPQGRPLFGPAVL